MKPTPEQIELANHWIDNRILNHMKTGMFVVMPLALRKAINNGVDFSDIFSQRGIAPNGVNFLPTFFDLNPRVPLPPK